MTNEFYFNLILFFLVAIIALELAAKKLRLPPAVAQLMGGAVIAFMPGLPAFEIDPALVLVVFLPPLLMHGAYFTVWHEFRRHLTGILLLAIGAVLFTTLVVGVALHTLSPALPWAACFALGAIVSPPDAIAAKAVLQRVALPRKLMVLLEGESLLNDATGLVLYKFSIAVILTGAFSLQSALGDFVFLSLGGILLGAAFGYLVFKTLRYLHDTSLMILASALPGWICYVVGEHLGVSGVIATVTYGMMLGWYQHEIMTATARRRGSAFWDIMIFMFESLVFILIGLSLRGVWERIAHADKSLADYSIEVLLVLAVVIASRFAWVFAVDAIAQASKSKTHIRRQPTSWRESFVKSWAGMRGVVTLAAALAVPAQVPGRDLMLLCAFAVILVTVLFQGTTIGWIIRVMKLKPTAHEHAYLNEAQTWARLEAAQYAVVNRLAHDERGNVIHPRLLEQYGYRANLSDTMKDAGSLPANSRQAHFNVVLAAVAAGRQELLRLHRSGQIHDDLLRIMERDLDFQEIAALHNRA
ncbi:sodium/proton antiporter, CPA1 family [Methylophilus rhizosphaerae]|uniref:Sodium/proton antiporter, CPA1 family n=1 Tax=Methylophilus rhizosphaerae TaxID=492660 RepID=A0A1G9DX29_9PROT|nr:Na+/H+ antiporter [Methylophilus rhizosphaerae]SDK68437.1 sodium/proton antiporter, CPA1 family [Methylophilus rhizosphaerae]